MKRLAISHNLTGRFFFNYKNSLERGHVGGVHENAALRHLFPWPDIVEHKRLDC